MYWIFETLFLFFNLKRHDALNMCICPVYVKQNPCCYNFYVLAVSHLCLTIFKQLQMTNQDISPPLPPTPPSPLHPPPPPPTHTHTLLELKTKPNKAQGRGTLTQNSAGKQPHGALQSVWSCRLHKQHLLEGCASLLHRRWEFLLTMAAAGKVGPQASVIQVQLLVQLGEVGLEPHTAAARHSLSTYWGKWSKTSYILGKLV